MRSRFVPALASLALLGSVGRELGAQGRGQDTRPGIAVLPFDNSGSYGQDKENFDALQKGIAGMLISELAANPAARVVERGQIEKLLAEQSLGASGKVTPETAAKIGKLVGARYVIAGTFIDFYGDFRLDARIVNVETSEIVKVESDRMQRDHLFDIIRTVAARLMKDANLPPLPRQASDQRMNRQVPTEALTFYAKALLYQDRGQKDKAAEMYQRALAVFPEYTEAQQGLQRAKRACRGSWSRTSARPFLCSTPRAARSSPSTCCGRSWTPAGRSWRSAATASPICPPRCRPSCSPVS